MKVQAILITCVFLFEFIFTGCMTTNYYTGRTLEKGKAAITPGLDNLILFKENGGNIQKKLFFSPSLGYARGLPLNFETGIRVYFPYVLEANIRNQLNPRTFDLFDVSANFHTGIIFAKGFEEVSHPYFKYGLTISKEIATVQPYLSYYFNKGFMDENNSDALSDFPTICFGLAIPYKDDLIFPEFNYYKNRRGGNGIISFGIGLRASLRRAKSRK